MENNVHILTSDGELYHHGIKGQKWGVRRFQTKNGSLTAAGRKRREKMSLGDKIREHRAAKKAASAEKKAAKKAHEEEVERKNKLMSKSVKDMTDEELAEYITRKNSERMALTLERDIRNLDPPKVSAGQQFANNIRDQVLGPSAMQAGKKLLDGILSKAVDKAVGKGAKDTLEEMAKKAGWQKAIEEAKFAANKVKMQEQELAKREKEAAEAANATGPSNTRSGDIQGKFTRRQATGQNTSKTRNDSTKSAKLDKDDYDFDDDSDKYTVEGTGTSRRNSTQNSRSNNRSYNDIVDAVQDEPSSGLSVTRNAETGRTYVDSGSPRIAGLLDTPYSNIAGYLPAPKDDDD